MPSGSNLIDKIENMVMSCCFEEISWSKLKAFVPFSLIFTTVQETLYLVES